MHIAICSDLDQRNGEAARLNERHRIAGQQSVALDRAGITVFPDIDTHPMDEDGHSRKRFRTAIEKLFKPISGEYDAGCMCKNGMHDRYCLYKGLKCGMAHIGHPQCSIAFTTRAEAKVDKTAHLVKDSQGTLILVAEDLADDFEAAGNSLKEMSSNRKTNKKITQPFITVRSYGYHRSF